MRGHGDALVAFVGPAVWIVGVCCDVFSGTMDDTRRHVEMKRIDVAVLGDVHLGAPPWLAEANLCIGGADGDGHSVADGVVAANREGDAVECGGGILVEVDLESAVLTAHDGGGGHVHIGAWSVVDAAVVVGAVALEVGLMAGCGADGECRPGAIAIDTCHKGVEVGQLHVVQVLVVACNEEEVIGEANPVDGVTELGGCVGVVRRADELIDEADVPHRVHLALGEVCMDGCHCIQATFLARDAVVFEEAVEAAHHLIALRPEGCIRVPLPEFLAVEGVAKEVGTLAILTVPIWYYFRSIVEVFLDARLLVEHEEGLEEGHGGDAHDLVVPRDVEGDVLPVHHVDELVHLAFHAVEDIVVVGDLCDHQHGPHDVFAVPDVPEAVPSEGGVLVHHLASHLVEGDAFLVGVRTEIAVRVLEGHEAVGFLLDEVEEFCVLCVVGDACCAEHELPPELASPHTASGHSLIVVPQLNGGASLGEDIRLGELREDAMGKKSGHLDRWEALKADVLQVTFTILVHLYISLPAHRMISKHF